MAGRVGVRAEINQWHQEFQWVRKEWVAWLNSNAANYHCTEDAWIAFKNQFQATNGKFPCQALPVQK